MSHHRLVHVDAHGGHRCASRSSCPTHPSDEYGHFGLNYRRCHISARVISRPTKIPSCSKVPSPTLPILCVICQSLQPLFPSIRPGAHPPFAKQCDDSHLCRRLNTTRPISQKILNDRSLYQEVIGDLTQMMLQGVQRSIHFRVPFEIVGPCEHNSLRDFPIFMIQGGQPLSGSSTRPNSRKLCAPA